jgi:hypothetical protein
MYPGPVYGTMTGLNLIGNDDNESVAFFGGGGFADKNSGIEQWHCVPQLKGIVPIHVV